MREPWQPGPDVKLLDMNADGSFVPQKAPASAWPLRLGIGAAIVALVCAGLAAAAIFLWLATLLVPVALLAIVVAYGAFRFQAWRSRPR